MKKTLIVISLFTGIVIGLELYFRFVEYDSLTYYTRPAIYQYDSIINYKYIPDKLIYRDNGIFKVNKQGYLGDDFDIDTPNLYRIAIVGSSNIAGTITLGNYYSFSNLLQQEFHKHGYKHVRVFNCGIDGAERSLENFNSITSNVLNFNPNLILLEVSLPLYSSHTVRKSYKEYVLAFPKEKMNYKFEEGKVTVNTLIKYNGILSIIYKSYLCRTIIKLYLKNSSSSLAEHLDLYQSKYSIYGYGGIIPTQLTMEESVKKIKNLKDSLALKNISFFTLTIKQDSTIRYFAKNLGIPLIPLNLTFSGEDYYPREDHYNDQGYSKIAVRLYEKLTKNNIVKQKTSD